MPLNCAAADSFASRVSSRAFFALFLYHIPLRDHPLPLIFQVRNFFRHHRLVHITTMGSWAISDVFPMRLQEYMDQSLLPALTVAEEWKCPIDDHLQNSPSGLVVSLQHFHERSLGDPPHPFLWELLHAYGIFLHHINPISLQHIAVFVALCAIWVSNPILGCGHISSMFSSGRAMMALWRERDVPGSSSAKIISKSISMCP